MYPFNTRRRGGPPDLELPFDPPEDWHEPFEDGRPFRFIVRRPGVGYRHVLTPADIRRRLAEMPPEFLTGLEVVQLSSLTKKKLRYPCYGMQWGASIYLYPVEEDLIENHLAPPTPAQRIEAAMYGARWREPQPGWWQLVWTEATIRDFYLNNILVHELGHLIDDRNASSRDRERFAEWFAVEWGYRRTSRPVPRRPKIVRRHHAKSPRLSSSAS